MNNDRVRCPDCGHELTVDEMYVNNLFNVDDGIEDIMCPMCDAQFTVSHYSVKNFEIVDD